MEIIVGEYVRTKYGIIGKVYDITNEPSVDIGIGIIPEVNAVWTDKDKINYLNKEEIIKHSKDIIDLIEVGDYVNGYLVIEVDKTNSSVIIDHKIDEGTYDSFYNDDGWDSRYIEDWVYERLYNYEIKTLLTKEQFESNAYKIGKER